MTIEEALREAAAKGLTHVTMWPVPAQDRNHMFWYARATPSTGHSYVQTHALDPVEALLEVLKALPKAPKRAKIDPHRGTTYEAQAEVGIDPGPEDVTVAVTSPAPDSLANWLPKG